jgi:hypothetical protein
MTTWRVQTRSGNAIYDAARYEIHISGALIFFDDERVGYGHTLKVLAPDAWISMEPVIPPTFNESA